MKDAAKRLLEIEQAELIRMATEEGKTETPLATIIRSNRAGSVDYPKLLESLGFADIPEEKIAQYREPSSDVVSVRKTAKADECLAEYENALLMACKTGSAEDADDAVKPAPVVALTPAGSMDW